MRLRGYQEAAIGGTLEKLRVHPSTLIVLPTGMGKTVVFSHLAHRWESGRVLVMAHLDELIGQAARKIKAITGESPAVEMGGQYSDEQGFLKSRIVVTSVQTMSRPRRHCRFNPDDFGLVVIDEAHHAVGDSYRKVMAHFERAKRVGVTATPNRSDEFALGQVFESVAFSMSLSEAKDEGWLVPILQRVVTVEGLDFSGLRTVAGDFNQSDLDRLLTAEGPLHKMAVPLLEIAGDRPAMAFCVSVRHAVAMAEVLNRYKAQSANFIAGDEALKQLGLPALGRQGIRARAQEFREGKINVLCCCQLGLEGFDAPDTACVAMCRATKSTVVYTQALGRGTRPAEEIANQLGDMPTAAERRAAIAGSAKPGMTVIDFCGNAGRHQIVTAADLLGGKWGSPVREYARKTQAEEGCAVPVEESLERAEAELELLSLLDAERKRRANLKGRVTYSTEDVDPFGGAAPARREVDQGVRGRPATDKQIRYLIRLGVGRDRAERMTARQAGAVIQSIKSQRDGGAIPA